MVQGLESPLWVDCGQSRRSAFDPYQTAILSSVDSTGLIAGKRSSHRFGGGLQAGDIQAIDKSDRSYVAGISSIKENVSHDVTT
jgi:hypothetical protein